MSRITKALSLLVCLLCPIMAAAQLATIIGTISDEKTTLSGATISLLKGADSSWLKTEISDDKGVFTFSQVSGGSYLLSATSVGYESVLVPIIVNESTSLPFNIQLHKSNNSLGEVAVTAKKPFIEMSLGKLVVNIEGTSTTAISTVLDLLRRLPGVSVDQNGNITMMGKAGVMVLIDDRPTYLSGDDLANYLRTITAEEVSQIELITQPGAKYDAAGNTGVINVKIKKNRKQGLNGNLTLSYGQGLYYNRHESLQVNYKKKKLNLSLGLTDMEAIGFADYLETLSYYNPATASLQAQTKVHSAPIEVFSNTALRLAVDYQFSESTSSGVNCRSNYHPNINHGYINTSTTNFTNNNLDFTNINSQDGFIRRDVMANAYITHKFSKEHSLDLNLDYLLFNKNAWQDIQNTKYDATMQPLPGGLQLHSQQPTNINVFSARADYSGTLKHDIKMDAGLKSSFVGTDNDAKFTQYVGGAWVYDSTRSNRFNYKENINAAYLNFSKTLNPKWDVRLGLRAEQTNSDGQQYVHDVHFTKHYLSLFPTGFLSYKNDSSNQFELNYGRRIDRPSYSQLNPFIYYAYDYNYNVGNPNLQPQFTNSIELKHSYKNMIITSLNYSATNDVMNDILEVNDSTRVVYKTQKNFASNNFGYAAIQFNKNIFKWWSFNSSVSVFYASYNGMVYNVNKHVEYSGYSVSVNTQFDFGKGWKADGYGYYNSNGRTSLTEYFSANGYMELGVSKKINERFLIKFSAEDPLYINKFHFNNEAANFKSDARVRYATQFFSLAITWKFGGKQSETHQISTIDEAGRVK